MSTQRVDNSSSSSVKLLGYGLDSWVPPTWSAIAVPYFYPWTAIKYGSPEESTHGAETAHAIEAAHEVAEEAGLTPAE
eukprot:1635528-Rhodomonas_salina.1